MPTRVGDALLEAQTLCGLNLLCSPVGWFILGRCDYYDYVGGYSLLQTLLPTYPHHNLY